MKTFKIKIVAHGIVRAKDLASAQAMLADLTPRVRLFVPDITGANINYGSYSICPDDDILPIITVETK